MQIFNAIFPLNYSFSPIFLACLSGCLSFPLTFSYTLFHSLTIPCYIIFCKCLHFIFSAIFATFFALRAAPVQKHQESCQILLAYRTIFYDLYLLYYSLSLHTLFHILFSSLFFMPFMPFLFHILHSHGAFRFGASFNRDFSCAACSTQKGMEKCRIAFSMPLSLICPYMPSYTPSYVPSYPPYIPYFFLSLSFFSYIFLPFYFAF